MFVQFVVFLYFFLGETHFFFFLEEFPTLNETNNENSRSLKCYHRKKAELKNNLKISLGICVILIILMFIF